MGNGPSAATAQTLLARDEHDPDAPLVRRRIVRTYERTAYPLQVSTRCVLTLADADGRRQTLRVTDEHPFYRTAPAAGGSADSPGWTPARSLAAGDEVLGDCGVLTVIASAREAHRQGVKVYNLAGPSRPTRISSSPNTFRTGRMRFGCIMHPPQLTARELASLALVQLARRTAAGTGKELAAMGSGILTILMYKKSPVERAFPS